MALIHKSRLIKKLVCFLLDVNEYQLDWAMMRLVKAPMYYYENAEQKIEGDRPPEKSGRTMY